MGEAEMTMMSFEFVTVCSFKTFFLHSGSSSIQIEFEINVQKILPTIYFY